MEELTKEGEISKEVTIDDLKANMEEVEKNANIIENDVSLLPVISNNEINIERNVNIIAGNDIDPLEESALAVTEDMSSGQKAEISRRRTRACMHARLKNKGMKLIDLMFDKAIKGQMRDSDCLKLLDLVAKYSIGSINQTELTGNDVPQIVMGFSMNNGNGEKVTALDYIDSVKQRIISQSQTTPSTELEEQNINIEKDKTSNR